ncbi:hypothetical protein DPMN_003942 [Dreissena polymorpha]|uniref:Uncharacterized protein n=1 Tax=Dreissena polymorpha TaxID=45954 RepID=A0A9D4MPV1_DREPO|nr:hypothetical protein DPMN_003942 [Dreissena polymorpha]
MSNTFQISYEATVTFNRSELTIQSATFQMDSLSKLILSANKKMLKLTGTNIVIQDDAVIDVSGGGDLNSGTGAATGSMGASYGGVGGMNSSSLTYGNAVTLEYVTGSGSVDARGGGYIKIEASGTVEIDGNLLANAQNSTAAGGASGGTIGISCATLQGHGTLSVNGGNTSMTGAGGGGGGRISIQCTTMSAYLGDTLAYGGASSSSPGAAGTIYKEYQQSGGAQFKTLTVDNNGQKTDSFTYCNGLQSVTDLIVQRSGQVIFKGDNNNVYVVSKLEGDFTGTLKITNGQSFEIATNYGTLSPYALMCKIVIAEGGQGTLPSKLLLTDPDTSSSDWYNLEVYGTVIAMREMTVSSGGKALIHSKSNSGLDRSSVKPAGNLSLNSIDVTTDGLLEISMDSTDLFTLTMIKRLNVKYGGIIKARHLLVNAPDIEVAYGGTLSLNGGNLNSGSAVGASGTSGAGGSHGGKGGDSANNMTNARMFVGPFSEATQLGSAGGNGGTQSGALGGGYLNLQVSNLLTVEGTVSADGDSANGTAGGGSGGSINVDVTKDMSGSGIISVKGGNSNAGGGGGGGRIRVNVNGDFHFQGSYTLCGGSATSGQAGGSGTSFEHVQQANVPGKVFNLYFDNSCTNGTKEGLAYIDVASSTLYTLKNLQIGDKTRVMLYTPQLHFKAEILTCGTGSTIIVEDNTIFSPNFELAYSAITCSFDLKPSGELRLPKSVELKGASSSLEGKLCC